MSVLLTSAGFTTETLKAEFLSLLPKPVAEMKVAFIDTASKVEKDRSYVEKDLEILNSLGLKHIAQIDVAEPQDNWITLLIQADVFYIEGGNTFYLLDKLRAAGLDMSLPRIIQNKMYVGVSAGSIVATPTIAITDDVNEVGMTELAGMGVVEFEVRPHATDSQSLENIEQYVQENDTTVYAFDDHCAVLVREDVVTVVGDGFHKKFSAV